MILSAVITFLLTDPAVAAIVNRILTKFLADGSTPSTTDLADIDGYVATRKVEREQFNKLTGTTP